MFQGGQVMLTYQWASLFRQFTFHFRQGATGAQGTFWSDGFCAVSDLALVAEEGCGAKLRRDQQELGGIFRQIRTSAARSFRANERITWCKIRSSASGPLTWAIGVWGLAQKDQTLPSGGRRIRQAGPLQQVLKLRTEHLRETCLMHSTGGFPTGTMLVGETKLPVPVAS